jgi:hypothetical protein
MMTLFIVGTIFAQDSSAAAGDAPQQAAQDATTQTAPSAPAQAEAAPVQAGPAPGDHFAFHEGVTIGAEVLLTGPNNGPETWTLLGFQPDFSFGKIGLGLDLSFHFMLYPDQDTPVKIYPGDWVPYYDNDGKSFLDIYLPKLLYVRYGLKGEDPLFAKLGSIDDLTLGDGFIMSDYSNTLFLPQQRIFGLDLGVDGSLFGFPYIGIEALTGNLAELDVVGGRLYARPLVDTAIPILKNMQVGATLVADTKPDLYAATTNAAKTIAAYGADIAVPILGGKQFPLEAFTDFAFDPNQSKGWMIGFGGRIIGIFTYGAQLRVLQDDFIPSYFNADYDIYRAQEFDTMQNAPGSGINPGWLASLGTSLLGDRLVFSTSLDGPFSPAGVSSDPDAADPTQYFHLRSVLRLAQIGTFPFFFDASYEKYLIGATSGFFPDLVDPTDAVIVFDVNYRTGAAVLTLAYNAQWDPATGQFIVTSSLRASVTF